MSQFDTQDDVGDAIWDASVTPRSGLRERAQWKLLSKNGPFPTAADRCDIWSGNTRDVGSLGSPNFIDLTQSLRSVGQKVPVIARISPAVPSRLEIIAGACRLTAISTARQGAAIERSYAIALPADDAAPLLVAELNRIEGVQNVDLRRA